MIYSRWTLATGCIVGVTPPGFFGVEVGQAFDLLMPVQTNPVVRPGIPRDEHTPWLKILLRLRTGPTFRIPRIAIIEMRRAHSPGWLAFKDCQ